MNTSVVVLVVGLVTMLSGCAVGVTAAQYERANTTREQIKADLSQCEKQARVIAAGEGKQLSNPWAWVLLGPVGMATQADPMTVHTCMAELGYKSTVEQPIEQRHPR